MVTIEVITALIIAYLFGSISSAIIVCKLMGLPDPRTQGSNNPGATNVLRIGGKKAAVITLFGDVLKGFLPVLAAKLIGLTPVAIGLVAFAAFIGHLYPIFFRFEGGKGVATLIGCLLAISWQVGLCWIAIFALIAITLRYISLASLIASLLAPFYTWYFTNNLNLSLIIALMSVFLIYRHRSNIAKLIAGKESKFGMKKKKSG